MVTPVAVARTRGPEQAATRPPRRVRVSSVGAATLLLAGSIHLIVAIAHVPGPAAGHTMVEATSWDHWAAAIVLALIGVAQIFVGAGLWVSPIAEVALIGVTLNAITLVLYVASRTAGLPFGTAAGQAEPVGLVDLSVALLELAGIVALVACLPERTRSRVTSLLMVGGVTLIGARLIAGSIG